MIANKDQVSLSEIYCECAEILETDKPKFLTLLEEHIRLEEIIPASFYLHFHSWTGRPREYPLQGFLWALILQKIFAIPRDELLLVFLHYSKELREFCGFDKVPDASKITRFKQDFVEDLQSVFDRLVDMTEPICQIIDAAKADMTIFDSSGIEAYVTENNPKFADRIIRQMKSWAKTMKFDEPFNPYKVAYSSMPTCAHANPEIKQQYINSHFCYAYKFGLVTNGLGIVRHIEFYDKDFFKSTLTLSWRKSLILPTKISLPTIQNFFAAHPLLTPKTFLGDAAFDEVQIYKDLLTGDTFGENRHFLAAYIPLNQRAGLEDSDYTINEDGIPCCPY